MQLQRVSQNVAQRKGLIVSVTLEECETRNVIRLESSIGIASAAELKKLLLQALGSGKKVRVSLESATDLGVTAVQLLWAAGCEAKRSGAGFAFMDAMPEEISIALGDAGFEKFSLSK
jgi:16S rRNA U1498 N3-methylase RsmE